MLPFVALASGAERRIGAFKPQELANTAWVFTTAGQSHAPLFIVMSRAAEQHVSSFEP